MTARKHHFISQCYLKGFAHYPEKPKLFVVDAKARKTFSTQPGNVAHERDFHRVEIGGIDPDAVEKGLATLESEISPALERMTAAGRFSSDDDRALILNLAALFAVKNPRQRENRRDFTERVNKGIMRTVTATPERWKSQVDRLTTAGVWDREKDDLRYEVMRDFVERDEYEITMPVEGHLQSEFSAFDAVLPFFGRRNWVTLRAPSKTSGFITSDHPVSLFWNDENRRAGLFSPGFGLRGTSVLFPVSSRIAIFGTFDTGPEFALDLTAEKVAAINSMTIGSSGRQIYARDGNFDYVSGRTGKVEKGFNLLQDVRPTR